MKSSLKELFKIKKNQITLVSRRGYDTSKEKGLLDYTQSEFEKYYDSLLRKDKNPNATFRTELSMSYRNPSGKVLHVEYLPSSGSAIGKSGIERIVSLKDTIVQLDTLIVVSEMDFNPESLQELKKSIPIRDQTVNIRLINFQLFLDAELKYDPTAHVLVPPHRLMTDEEVRKLLEETGWKLSEFPALKYVDPFYRSPDKNYVIQSDAMVKYHGFLPGQVIEISRDNSAVVAKETFLLDTLVRNSIAYRFVKY